MFSPERNELYEQQSLITFFIGGGDFFNRNVFYEYLCAASGANATVVASRKIVRASNDDARKFRVINLTNVAEFIARANFAKCAERAK